MSAPKLTFKDYFKAAFWNQFNLIPLGGLLAASVLAPFGGMGFLFAAAAWEVAWLSFVPTSERFQRRVRAELSKDDGLKEEEENELLFRRLEPRERSKFGEIQSICYSLEGQLASADPTTRTVLEESFRKLGYLLRTYLRLMVSLSGIRQYLKQSDRDNILASIRRLEQEIADPNAFDRVKDVKQKNILVLRQRLTRIEKARENEAVIEANLHTLEDTLKLIRDNAMSLDNPQGVSKQIQSVVIGLEESERVLKDIEAFASLDDKVMGTLSEVGEDEAPRNRVRG